MAFDDEAFAITSAISKPAAVPMYNGVRATEAKTRSKRALAVGEGSDELFWGTPKQCKKKKRAGIVFRAAGGGSADRRPPIEDTALIFTSCRHQQSIKTIWEYQVEATAPLRNVQDDVERVLFEI